MFKAQEDQRLREMGMVPGSFEAQQFEKKVLEGEMIGFSSSALTSVATGSRRTPRR